ncbi:MAG: DUF1592 domain-containing protein [Planctomycetota bacterium]
MTFCLPIFVIFVSLPTVVLAQSSRTLDEAKTFGQQKSKYLNKSEVVDSAQTRVEADLKTYREIIGPLLNKACQDCHGEHIQEAEFRIDNLNPDMLHGQDEDWWLEVQNVLSNAEMPPADAEVQLDDGERSKIIQWLSQEVQFASKVRRGQKEHSSFRRLTRYEYSYAMQDLLGLPFDFGADLPPETASEDGFLNSSEYLQMSVNQLEKYRQLARRSLGKAIVQDDKPDAIHYSISMDLACEAESKALAKNTKADKNANHFLEESTGKIFAGGHRDVRRTAVFRPQHLLSKDAKEKAPSKFKVLMLPANSRQYVNLGKYLPRSGPMKIRVKAARDVGTANKESNDVGIPGVEIRFGFRPTNDSYLDFPIGPAKTIRSQNKKSQWYEWEVHLGEIPRNSYRELSRKGPNPTEFIVLRNTAKDREVGAIRIEEVDIVANQFVQWPPASHRSIFPDREDTESEVAYSRRVLEKFMQRAWRRPITRPELERKLKLLGDLRPTCDSLQEALAEVLATVISSPNFLYLQQSKGADNLSDFELASRMAIFLWGSIPDEALFKLACENKLSEPATLVEQTKRMLADRRSLRFSEQFVRQWLGLQLLDYLDVDKKTYRDINQQVVNSMKREPVEMFRHMLENDLSIMDFIHADYTMADRTLARHYGIKAALGSEFQKVRLTQNHSRGGLLTQPGLLAMNSDGKDSNPLKRGIWLLERILNDPPPPPPPAVPEIDLADPAILKMTLKERLEDHRNDEACKSCHQRIDPWGIAFENFDAVGRWRNRIGTKTVDASSVLFNQQKLDGANGLKRYLLENRQDQFAQALVTKMIAYALGRPVGFSDRAAIESITTSLRQQNDGLATMVQLIVTSEIFRSK